VGYTVPFQVSHPESIHPSRANPEDAAKLEDSRAVAAHQGGSRRKATGQLCNGTDLQWDQQLSHKKCERLISSPMTTASNSCLIATGSSFRATRSCEAEIEREDAALPPSVYDWMRTGQRGDLGFTGFCHSVSTPPGARSLPTLPISARI